MSPPKVSIGNIREVYKRGESRALGGHVGHLLQGRGDGLVNLKDQARLVWCVEGGASAPEKGAGRAVS